MSNNQLNFNHNNRKYKTAADFTVKTTFDVQFRDIDAYQHVNNSTYLSYFENGRIAYYLELPFFKKKITETDALSAMRDRQSLVLTSTGVEYRRQILLGQKITVATVVTAIRKNFIDTRYGVFDENEKLLATGYATQIMIDLSTGKPVKVPELLAGEIINLEKKVHQSSREF